MPDVKWTLASKDTWKRFVLHNKGVGLATGFYVTKDGKPIIQLGNTSHEKNIEHGVNHEFLHFILWKIGANTNYLDCICEEYIDLYNIPLATQLFLKGGYEYGLGFK